jgi:hypothetical protein
MAQPPISASCVPPKLDRRQGGCVTAGGWVSRPAHQGGVRPPPGTGARRPQCHRSHPSSRFTSSPASWPRLASQNAPTTPRRSSASMCVRLPGTLGLPSKRAHIARSARHRSRRSRQSLAYRRLGRAENVVGLRRSVTSARWHQGDRAGWTAAPGRCRRCRCAAADTVVRTPKRSFNPRVSGFDPQAAHRF